MNHILKTFVILCICSLCSCSSVRKTIFKDDFKKNMLGKHWATVNGTWAIQDGAMSATSNAHWAIMLCNKQLPNDYILTFSTLIAPEANLFEVITNLNGEKYLGILLNQLSKNVAIEDRSLFSKEKAENEGGYISTTGNIGKLPEVENENRYIWLDWKIQKTDNMIFVWINEEAIISFTDAQEIVKKGGRFGFAVNGEAKIKNVRLQKIEKEAALPPENFEGRPPVLPFFLFGE